MQLNLVLQITTDYAKTQPSGAPPSTSCTAQNKAFGFKKGKFDRGNNKKKLQAAQAKTEKWNEALFGKKEDYERARAAEDALRTKLRGENNSGRNGYQSGEPGGMKLATSCSW